MLACSCARCRYSDKYLVISSTACLRSYSIEELEYIFTIFVLNGVLNHLNSKCFNSFRPNPLFNLGTHCLVTGFFENVLLQTYLGSFSLDTEDYWLNRV